MRDSYGDGVGRLAIENLTPFAAVCMPFMDLTNADIALIIVSGRFHMPAPGQPAPLEPLMPTAKQPPVPLGDSYVGQPGMSSLRWEGQAGCSRAGTDIYLHGHACAPQGHTVRRLPAMVRVGAYERHAMVFGDRY